MLWQVPAADACIPFQAFLCAEHNLPYVQSTASPFTMGQTAAGGGCLPGFCMAVPHEQQPFCILDCKLSGSRMPGLCLVPLLFQHGSCMSALLSFSMHSRLFCVAASCSAAVLVCDVLTPMCWCLQQFSPQPEPSKPKTHLPKQVQLITCDQALLLCDCPAQHRATSACVFPAANWVASCLLSHHLNMPGAIMQMSEQQATAPSVA